MSNHSGDIFANVNNIFCSTSKEGLPPLVPTIFSTTVGAHGNHSCKGSLVAIRKMCYQLLKPLFYVHIKLNIRKCNHPDKASTRFESEKRSGGGATIISLPAERVVSLAFFVKENLQR
jgi:hypothetical protein